MARRRKMTPERREFINGLLEHYQPTDAQDVQEMLKDLLGDTLQGMLEAEMDQKLGYSKYDYQNKESFSCESEFLLCSFLHDHSPSFLSFPSELIAAVIFSAASGLLITSSPYS